jgi:hypothetical protein
MSMNKISRWLSDFPDAHIDCFLFAAIAWFTLSQAYLGGDEAAKFLSPATKFWLNYWVASGGAIAGAVKMFRSTSYAKHKEDKKMENDTQVFKKFSEPGPVP